MGPRIVSLVPSWTETLIEVGALVVGRSRFCIHPVDRVADIVKVGGTKDVDWEKVRGAGADLLVLDREENTREMAEASPLPVIATHVRAIDDCARELRNLARSIEGHAAGSSRHSLHGPPPSARLRDLASRWAAVAAAPSRSLDRWEDLPGVLDWLRRPESPPGPDWASVYLVWQDPWMTVRPETFIGSVLDKVGLGALHRRGFERDTQDPGGARSTLYPEVHLESLPRTRTLLLLSSEPFPFARRPDRALALDFPTAVVDGESFSWFGLRVLRFLESVLGP